jgi:hypothetical protein
MISRGVHSMKCGILGLLRPIGEALYETYLDDVVA